MSTDATAAASSQVPAQRPPATEAVAAAEAPPPARPAAAPLLGDPTALGLPCFVVGSVSLGLALVGVVPGHRRSRPPARPPAPAELIR